MIIRGKSLFSINKPSFDVLMLIMLKVDFYAPTVSPSIDEVLIFMEQIPKFGECLNTNEWTCCWLVGRSKFMLIPRIMSGENSRE